jgi:hypothetical protein
MKSEAMRDRCGIRCGGKFHRWIRCSHLLLTFAVEIGDLVVAADPDKISSENMS